MKIGIVGLGYIGLVTAAVLADEGNEVIGIDTDKKKIEMLNKLEAPIYEPGLLELLKKNSGRFLFSDDYSKLKGSDLVYIVVPTPTDENGRQDASYVHAAAKRVADVISNVPLAIKSTVLPGTARQVSKETGMSVVSNPEFTAEGRAIEDTRHPDRIVIGFTDEKAGALVEKLWSFTNAPIIKTTNENAELIKYASNAFLATKISFINEIANLCEKIPDADINVVAKGMGFDKRIAPYFLRAGLGYGGSCFPKDTKALITMAREKGERLSIIEAAAATNEARIERAFKRISELAEKEGRNIAVLGLAFKENTDDIRESQSIKLINKLVANGYNVQAYDPVVKKGISNVKLWDSVIEAINNSNVVVIATEWPEFKNINEEMLNGKPVVDLRRVLDAEKFRNIKAIGLGR